MKEMAVVTPHLILIYGLATWSILLVVGEKIILVSQFDERPWNSINSFPQLSWWYWESENPDKKFKETTFAKLDSFVWKIVKIWIKLLFIDQWVFSFLFWLKIVKIWIIFSPIHFCSAIMVEDFWSLQFSPCYPEKYPELDYQLLCSQMK